MDDELTTDDLARYEADHTYALKNLLAVIHRDGGHHTDACGIPQSVQDACDVFYKLLARVEELEAQAKAIEPVLQWEAIRSGRVIGRPRCAKCGKESDAWCDECGYCLNKSCCICR